MPDNARSHQAMQREIPALYMRGGTSKGVFFLADDLPSDPALRERVLLRIVGSPDPYGKQIDGMGGATSSTSKIIIVSRSQHDGSDVEYLFGQVSIDAPLIDWSGNCGNLTTAVGAFAIHRGLIQPERSARMHRVRLWQANIQKNIIAHIPVRDGQVVEDGAFSLDGVTFPAAEIRLEFLDPGEGGGSVFPTGRVVDVLDIPGHGPVETSLVTAGNPTVFVAASALGLRGDELPDEVNRNADVLKLAEAIRAHGAVAMGLAQTPAEATERRPATPKLAFVAQPATYVASNGETIEAGSIDILARIFSMGKLHHAMTGTGGVAIAAGAAVPGTILRQVAKFAGGQICFGHPSGRLSMGVEARQDGSQWLVTKVTISRSARRLMSGAVLVPESIFSNS